MRIGSFEGDSTSETQNMIHQLAWCVLLSHRVPSIKLNKSHLLCCRLTSQLYFGVQIIKKRVLFVGGACSSLSCLFMRGSVYCSTFMFNYCTLLLFSSVCDTGPSITRVGGLWYGAVPSAPYGHDVHSSTCTVCTWRSQFNVHRVDMTFHGCKT